MRRRIALKKRPNEKRFKKYKKWPFLAICGETSPSLNFQPSLLNSLDFQTHMKNLLATFRHRFVDALGSEMYFLQRFLFNISRH